MRSASQNSRVSSAHRSSRRSSGRPGSLRPAPAHVEVHDLRARGEPGADSDLEEAVIESRTGMEEYDGRPFPHPRALRDELRPLDVEEQAYTAYLHTHGATLLSPGIRQRNWSLRDDRESTRDRRGTRRVGDRCTPARARARAVRGRPGARAPLRAGPGDRRGRCGRSPAGPWVAHVSGATPLAALDPHVRRFSVHPLQTFTRARGAEQLDGAFAAVSAETDEAREVGLWLARTLGLEPFTLADRSAWPTTPAQRSPRATS